MAGEDSSRVCKAGSPGGFRWLCLARSVLALVVTVIAAIVLVKGMILVLQFDTSTIQLNIAQSDVFVYRYEETTFLHNTYYEFKFYLEANNPSEVLFISYHNITVQLWKDDAQIAMFDLYPSSLSLSQKEEQEYFVRAIAVADNVTAYAVQELFTNEIGGTIDGAAMVLYGQLSVLNLQQSVPVQGHEKNGGYEPTNFTCKAVTVKSVVPIPKPSSQNYKTECLKG